MQNSVVQEPCLNQIPIHKSCLIPKTLSHARKNKLFYNGQ